jgi:4-aminobutyrate aminotransferase/(S)-3-amino-2-methylpropionate transaminase
MYAMNPSITNAALQERRRRVVASGNTSAMGQYIAKGNGAILTDVEGNEYIDFAGGIAVMNVGHSHPKVVAAVKQQAAQLTHTCFMVSPYETAIRLAEKLCTAVPCQAAQAVMFANSGAEAVENAVKIARYHTGKSGIIAFENAFHGRTLLGMSLTSKVKPYKYGFGPYAPEVYRMPFAYCYRCPINLTYPKCGTACAECLADMFVRQVAPEQTAAIIIEPIQGEGGFIAPPLNYFQKLKAVCEKNQVLFIADEIQTGMGRTGTMFAMEHFGVEADMTTVAKSLAAGMPLSAVVGKKEIMDSVHPSGVGGTYGGNPVACAAALAVIDIFDTEDLLARSKTLGKVLRTHLEKFKQDYEIVGDVRGMGPMMAMELVKDRHTKIPAAEEAKSLTAFCLEKNLILLSCGVYGNVVRFLMPLVISKAQLEQGLSIVGEGLQKLSEWPPSANGIGSRLEIC